MLGCLATSVISVSACVASFFLRRGLGCWGLPCCFSPAVRASTSDGVWGRLGLLVTSPCWIHELSLSTGFSLSWEPSCVCETHLSLPSHPVLLYSRAWTPELGEVLSVPLTTPPFPKSPHWEFLKQYFFSSNFPAFLCSEIHFCASSLRVLWCRLLLFSESYFAWPIRTLTWESCMFLNVFF